MNDYSLLVNSQDFFSRLKSRLRLSKNEILMQFLTFEADSPGIELAEILIKKAKEGVNVKILIDKFNDYMINDNFILSPKSIFKGYYKEYFETQRLFKRLMDSGIELKRTGNTVIPVLFSNHKKIIIIDDYAYLGGFNISEHNFSWHDFMFEIRGDIVAAIRKDFVMTWNGKEKTYSLTRGMDTLLSDIPKKSSMIYNLLVDSITKAKKQIFIESPYFSGRKLIRLLKLKAAGGAKVILIMPYNNNRLYYRPLTRYYSRYMKNIELRFYRCSEGMTHAKIILVDDTLFFGSSNLAEQSSLLCKEIMIMTRNRSAVSQARKKIIEQDIADSIILKKIERNDLLAGRILDFFQNRVLTKLLRE
ncbi:MAG: phospholipase D-like domain-containing protein [Candidatus Woesearchaeota archaeon]|nr:phospholipase D-like domain-containing protein [Candidatus Woesearchaeota archaeon]